MINRMFVVCVLGLSILLGLVISIGSHGGDYTGFLIAGQRFIDGSFLYQGSSVGQYVTWPPFFALFISPFSVLSSISPLSAQVTWYLLNAFCVLLSVRIWSKIVHGIPLFMDSPEVLVPMICIFLPFLDAAKYLQVTPVILLLISLSILSLQDKRPIFSGVCMGCAVALKAYPFLFIFYLLFRKHYKSSIAMVITAFLLTLLPIFRYGLHPYIENIQAWINISFLGGYPVGFFNQSIYAMVCRDLHFIVPVATRTMIASWIYRALFVGTVLAFFYKIRKREPDEAMEGAFFLTLVMVFSPIAWHHYWILTLGAFFVLQSMWDRWPKVIMGIVVGLMGVPALLDWTAGYTAVPVIQAWALRSLSTHTIGAAVLLIALMFCIGKKQYYGWNH